MTDYISSFIDNIKQKTSNPFLGTLIFVSIVRYWDIIYAIFSFDDDCDYLYKSTFIHNYFSSLNFWKELAWILLDSFAILLGTYILLSISKFFLEVYEKHMLSRIIKFTDKNSVKTLDEYKALEKTLSESLEKLRKADNDHQQLEIRIGNLKTENSDKEQSISQKNIRIGEIETLISNSADQIFDLNNEIQKLNMQINGLETIVDEASSEYKDLNKQFISLQQSNEVNRLDREGIIDLLGYRIAKTYEDVYRGKFDTNRLVNNMNYFYATDFNHTSEADKISIQSIFTDKSYIDFYIINSVVDNGISLIEYSRIRNFVQNGFIEPTSIIVDGKSMIANIENMKLTQLGKEILDILDTEKH